MFNRHGSNKDRIYEDINKIDAVIQQRSVAHTNFRQDNASSSSSSGATSSSSSSRADALSSGNLGPSASAAANDDSLFEYTDFLGDDALLGDGFDAEFDFNGPPAAEEPRRAAAGRPKGAKDTQKRDNQNYRGNANAKKKQATHRNRGDRRATPGNDHPHRPRSPVQPLVQQHPDDLDLPHLPPQPERQRRRVIDPDEDEEEEFEYD